MKTVFEWAVECQRKALEQAQKRGASGETVAAAQTALALFVAEDARVGAGAICVCGAPQAAHDINGRRLDEARDGYGMKWGEQELCSQFRPMR